MNFLTIILAFCGIAGFILTLGAFINNAKDNKKAWIIAAIIGSIGILVIGLSIDTDGIKSIKYTRNEVIDKQVEQNVPLTSKQVLDINLSKKEKKIIEKTKGITFIDFFIPICIIFFLFQGFRAVRRDDLLVRSYDRLR